MNIAFLSDKGGASKTTYARIVAEYFKYSLPKNINTAVYSEEEKSLVSNVNSDFSKVSIKNVTNHEVSIKRYMKYFSIVNVTTQQDSLFNKKLVIQKSTDGISIYDVGADVFQNLLVFEESEEGQDFFSNLDVVFVPIKYDQESIDAARKIIYYFQKYSNISFVFCLTEYMGEIKSDFRQLFSNDVLMTAINILQYRGKARIITVPFSKYIRDSDTANMTLYTYANTLEDTSKQDAHQFIKDLFQKFDYAFFGFDRDPEKVSTSKENNDVVAIGSSELLEKLSSIQKQLQHQTNVRFDNSESNEYEHEFAEKLELVLNEINDLNGSLENLSPLKKLALSLDELSTEEILKQFKEKYVKNTKKVLWIFVVSTVLLPAVIFSIVGYSIGVEQRKNEIKNELQSQVRYANDLARDLVRKGATDSLVFGITPGNDTVSIMCNEKSNRCTTRYDFNTKQGIIEIK